MTEHFVVHPSVAADYLAGFSEYYPQIDRWFERVQHEVARGQRSMFAAFLDGALSGMSITKNCEDAKLCHISVSDEGRRQGLGMLLVHAAVTDVLARGARTIHVTTSEEVAAEHGSFFSRCGFEFVDFRKNRYRRNSYELNWFASKDRLVRRLRIGGEKLTRPTSSPEVTVLRRRGKLARNVARGVVVPPALTSARHNGLLPWVPTSSHPNDWPVRPIRGWVVLRFGTEPGV